MRLTADARDDIVLIKTYFADRDAVLGDRIMTIIAKVIRTLTDWPHLGHRGHRAGTREFLVPRLPFVIVYRIDLGTRAGIYPGAAGHACNGTQSHSRAVAKLNYFLIGRSNNLIIHLLA